MLENGQDLQSAARSQKHQKSQAKIIDEKSRSDFRVTILPKKLSTIFESIKLSSEGRRLSKIT